MFHPLVQQIQDILKQHNVWFETFTHDPVTTSEEAAALRVGYTIEQGAKALIIQIKLRGGERQFIMCVLPGNRRVVSKKIREMTQSSEIRFATKEEIGSLVEGLVRGAVPPFGNLFGLPVYIDTHLLKNEKIIFNAGDREFSLGMYLKDYLEIVQPHIEKFAE